MLVDRMTVGARIVRFPCAVWRRGGGATCAQMVCRDPGCLDRRACGVDDFAAPKGAEDRQLWLQNGEPMLFAGGTQGISLDREALRLKVVAVENGDWQAAGVIVHDVTNRSIAHMLVEMPFGPFPMALGVLYDDPRPTFENAVAQEREQATAGKEPNLAKLLGKGQSWTVGDNAADPMSTRPPGQGEPGAADPR